MSNHKNTATTELLTTFVSFLYNFVMQILSLNFLPFPTIKAHWSPKIGSTFLPLCHAFNLAIVSIVNRKFWAITNRVLHEEGRVVLGELRFEEDFNDGHRQAVLVNKWYKQVPFPEVPMPKNVVDFAALHIRYVDDKVMAMLDKMLPLLRNVNLCFQICNIAHQTVTSMWKKLDPLLDKHVESVFGDEDTNLIFRLEFHHRLGDHNLRMIFVKKLVESHIPFYLKWLTNAAYGEASNVRPRMLIVECASARELIKFYVAIKEESLFKDEHLNNETAEVLCVQKIEKNIGDHGPIFRLFIRRHQAFPDTEWLAEQEKQIFGFLRHHNPDMSMGRKHRELYLTGSEPVWFY